MTSCTVTDYKFFFIRTILINNEALPTTARVREKQNTEGYSDFFPINNSNWTLDLICESRHYSLNWANPEYTHLNVNDNQTH